MTVAFAQATYAVTEGGPAVPVSLDLSKALDRALSITLATWVLGTNVTEADYALEAVAPARLAAADPEFPGLLILTLAAGTSAATLMVAAVADTEVDPGTVSIAIRTTGLPDDVVVLDPYVATVNFLEPDAFTDPRITAGTTPIKAVHFDELRARIAALRVREGLPAAQWTDAALTPGITPVRRVHLTGLRAALDAVYDEVGENRPTYMDAALLAEVTTIKAVHVMELRAAIMAIE